MFVCADNGVGYFVEQTDFKMINTDTFNSSIDHMLMDYQEISGLHRQDLAFFVYVSRYLHHCRQELSRKIKLSIQLRNGRTGFI